MIEMFGVDQILHLYDNAKHFPIKVSDLRRRKAITKGSGTVILNRIDLPGDSKGYSKICLDKFSEFCNIEKKKHRLRGGDYNSDNTLSHHENSRHEFLVANSALDADVIINVPKLKTHKKAGVTLNLKNMVGIIGDKNWLPHFQLGSRVRGGDEYPYSGLLREAENIAKDCFLRYIYGAGKPVLNLAQIVSKAHRIFTRKTGFASIRSGSWHGNDTIWRSIVDINKIVVFADRQGIIRETPQRRLFSVVDGVIAGEKDGPLSPSPKNAGILCAGKDWTTVDIVLATYMGFDYLKIPQFVNALRVKDLRFTDFSEKAVRVRTNLGKDCCTLEDISAHADHFIPPDGWINFIEERSRAGAEIEARE